MHSVKESETQTARRLAYSPPELWSGKDRIASRRLRFRREMALKKAQKENRSIVPVVMKYPEGPFWPFTLQENEEGLREYKRQRKLEIFMARHPHLQLFADGNDSLYAYNPSNGRNIPGVSTYCHMTDGENSVY
ncbi:uncharacterized protein MCYG_04459 [Microsporum canis CBS 113480]|uniref:Uncharacterized protein n=1 Tax=Arthroderma otae (strain ATCC MYA-4605 / CBS 113480) TaxID=554155 RepID=C5FPN5_ARTOC|nr:uncharacterized protein MCYG_04459 [Microsporum canis CBS 113480]EEQ31640.1 predicted protein [Microsporum canis CBS 113480]